MHLVDITKENRWDDLYLSTDPENVRGKHVYEKAGFRSEHEMLDDEELYKYVYPEN